MTKWISLILAIPFLAGCTSAQQKAEYRDAQIKAIQVQTESRERVIAQKEAAQANMWAALAQATANNPEAVHSLMIVAAVAAARDQDEDSTPMVALQREQNEALEVAKVVAGPLLNAATGIAVAGINASVLKNDSDNDRMENIANFRRQQNVVNAVASLGNTAASNQGTVINVSDEAYLNTGSVSSTETFTSMDTTTTETNSHEESNSSEANVTTTTSTYTTEDNSVRNNVLNVSDELIDEAATDVVETMTFTVEDDEQTEGETCVPAFTPSGYDCS